jgi:hypothetical protein
MGSRGPIPKRDAERRRCNKPEQPTDTIITQHRVHAPAVDKAWHPIAKRLYQSLKRSAQAKFFEPSDWAAAYLLAESISRDLNPQVVGIAEKTGEVLFETIPLKGASLAAYLKAFAALGMTEGDRRRMRIEVQYQAPVRNADVTEMDEYRRARQG